jgi:hypothetical protein
MKTAATCKVFEEHQGAVSAVKFNKDGTMLASY